LKSDEEKEKGAAEAAHKMAGYDNPIIIPE
jgi:hypothetical protein